MTMSISRIAAAFLVATLLVPTLVSAQPSPLVAWTSDLLAAGQEVRGLVFDPERNVLFVGSTYGVGASVHQVDPAANGTELSMLTLPDTPDAVDDLPPHMINTFEATQFAADGSVDYILFVINDGQDADGTSIGRVVRYDPASNSFAWTLKTMKNNPNATTAQGGYAEGTPSLSADGSTAYICQGDGTLAAISTSLGQYVWQVVDGAHLVSCTGVAVLGETLYATTGRMDGRGMPGLHVYSAVNGDYVESYTTFSGDGMRVGPYATDTEGVYVTDTRDGLHKFDSTTSIATTPPAWIVKIEQGTATQTTYERPLQASLDPTVLFATSWHTVGRVSTVDGSVAWRRGFGATFSQPPLLSTNNEHLYTASAIPFAQGEGGDVRKINSANGDVEWRLRISGGFDQEIRGALNLNTDDSILYFATSGARVYAVYTATPVTPEPTMMPTSMPTMTPTMMPTSTPTNSPTSMPTNAPTTSPTASPSIFQPSSSPPMSLVSLYQTMFASVVLVVATAI